MHVGSEERVPANASAQVAVCEDCYWRGSTSVNDALRVIQKMDHEDDTGHEVIWVQSERE